MSNQHHSEVNPRRLARLLAAVVLAASLGGCVAYPGYGPGYYGYGPGYYGYPEVVVPAPVVGFGYWGGGGEHGGGHGGGHWH